MSTSSVPLSPSRLRSLCPSGGQKHYSEETTLPTATFPPYRPRYHCWLSPLLGRPGQIACFGRRISTAREVRCRVSGGTAVAAATPGGGGGAAPACRGRGRPDNVEQPLQCAGRSTHIILYAVYNNLMFVNLMYNHPSMYLVISSSRLLMTAVVWQMQFKVQISPIRKGALILITLGIFTKDMMGQEPSSDEENKDGDTLSSYYAASLLIIFQMSCSVMAGIYNKNLLKNDGCDQYLQNISLYVNSVVINLLIEAGFMRSKEKFDFASEMEMLVSPISISIVLTLATAGIMSSMVLRYENSITKGVASASETILTSTVEFFCYGYTFMMPELFGSMLVGAGIVLYSFTASLGLQKKGTRLAKKKEIWFECKDKDRKSEC